jgi:hypothetical protein
MYVIKVKYRPFWFSIIWIKRLYSKHTGLAQLVEDRLLTLR